MLRTSSVVLAGMIVGVLGCELATPTAVVTETSISTSMPTVAATDTPAPTETTTPTLTSIPIPNLLNNPGFEGSANKETADLTVPVGWRAWSSCDGVIHSELEAHPPHVREGRFAARVWQSYNTCAMGFYQQVNVTSGNDYLLTAYGRSWSTGHPVVGSPSEAEIKMWVGIDPHGGANPSAASIVWSDVKAAMDAYGTFTVVATAHNSVITVVLRSTPDWGLARNDTFWDDLCIREVYPIATPTQVVGTPSIIEVTPLGGTPWGTPQIKVEAMSGTYTPYNTQNVRYGPGIDYAIRYRLAAGKTVQVFAWLSSLPDEAWLCLDGDLCNEALALVYNKKELGNLIYD